ncbi:hypothetical protein VFPPC_07394 [Pochonia chlamydosporia 170]|uniref:Uncharacterized protein n=1 Tax=Pochonia chlamydosporia 170 TaxID=1380566 RepID=A0A179F979_METCM|nr:hypothetical protein VFPPC_07394 [Pochonia chlamydosporia 170]OAQ61890.2 hypothetical protein VFPPC_07394 [Pochonia chlamydosporia 170]
MSTTGGRHQILQEHHDQQHTTINYNHHAPSSPAPYYCNMQKQAALPHLSFWPLHHFDVPDIELKGRTKSLLFLFLADRQAVLPRWCEAAALVASIRDPDPDPDRLPGKFACPQLAPTILSVTRLIFGTSTTILPNPKAKHS